jgi:hypothetical protein
MDRGAETLWPAHESLPYLMLKLATDGKAAFESEKQNNPINPEACEFSESYFDHGAFWFDTWPDSIGLRVLCLDPSKGKSDRVGDYSAFVRMGQDKSGVLDFEADLQRRNVEQIVADGVEHAKQFRPHGFGLEGNAWQELLAAPFLMAADKQNLHLPIFTLENVVNKKVRIRGLTTWLAQKKMRFKRRSPGTTLLVDQLRDFPQADFDDGPDTAEMCVRLGTHLLSGGGDRIAGVVGGG